MYAIDLPDLICICNHTFSPKISFLEKLFNNIFARSLSANSIGCLSLLKYYFPNNLINCLSVTNYTV